MRHSFRITLATALFAAVACASAQTFTYSNLTSADTGLVGLSGSGVLTVGGPAIGPAGTSGLIDFFPTSLAVGDGTGIASKSLTFDYNVSASSPIGSIGLVLQGTLGGAGLITFQEIVFDSSNNVVAAFGNSFTIGGTTFPRGNLSFSGHSYTYTDDAPFASPQTDYRVEKSFRIDVPENFIPAVDFASVTLVEQNHQPVPEPAAFIGLGIGALGILARRHRK